MKQMKNNNVNNNTPEQEYTEHTEYTVYSKVSCSSCDTAELLLKNNDKEYTKMLLDVHFSIIELYQVAPRTIKTFPVILKGGKFLGGLAELKTDLGVQ